MPNLNHEPQFVPLIESGEKNHTIRPLRSRPYKPGDRLHHFAAGDQEGCRKFLETDCVSADAITILKDGSVRIERAGGACDVIDSLKGVARLAHEDGFRGAGATDLFYQFVTFFQDRYGLPFEGQLVGWRPQPPDQVVVRRKTRSKKAAKANG